MTEEKLLPQSYLADRLEVGEEFGASLQRMVDKWEEDLKISGPEVIKEFDDDEFKELLFSDVKLSAIGENFADVIEAPTMKLSVQSKVERMFGYYGPYTLLFDGESYYVYRQL